jgi:iron(III) transport system permease protein
MPAYVVAYAYTDFLQFSGPLQTACVRLRPAGPGVPRGAQRWRRGLGVCFALYPYVYLLARTALSERAAHLMEAARLLGAPLRGAFRPWHCRWPARPWRPGVALALMETLADFGVSSYFGIQTFTTGIYKAWLSMDNRVAAAQLATVLLVVSWRCCCWSSALKSACVLPATRGARAGTAGCAARCAC